MIPAVNPTEVNTRALHEGKAANDRQAQLARAAAMLEGVFLREMLKAMRRTVPESSLFGKSLGQDIYTEMFDGAVADELARGGGVGLQRMLLREFGALEGGRVPSAPVSPAQAAARFRQVSQSLPLTGSDPASGAAVRTPAGGTVIDGLAFEAPRRPEPVQLRDPDGQLHWLLAPGAAVRATAQGEISAQAGTDVLAPGSGRVVAASQDTITVDHGNGLSTTIRGLGQVEAQPGDLLLRGQVVGKTGASGRLQLEGRRDGTAMNYEDFWSLFDFDNQSQQIAKAR